MTETVSSNVHLDKLQQSLEAAQEMHMQTFVAVPMDTVKALLKLRPESIAAQIPPLPDSDSTTHQESGVDFDRDRARLDGIRNAMRDSRSLYGIALGDAMFLLSFIDKLWREYSRTNTKLDQYTRALWTANGFLMQLGRDPVKLEYNRSPESQH